MEALLRDAHEHGAGEGLSPWAFLKGATWLAVTHESAIEAGDQDVWNQQCSQLVEHLLERCEWIDGYFYWPHQSEYSVLRLTAQTPFFGAFANCVAAYGALTLIDIHNDPALIQIADALIATVCAIEEAPIPLSAYDENGWLWLNEYVFHPQPEDLPFARHLGLFVDGGESIRLRVYNGHIHALLALMKHARVRNTDEYAEIIEQATRTLRHALPHQIVDDRYARYLHDLPRIADYGQDRAVFLAEGLEKICLHPAFTEIANQFRRLLESRPDGFQQSVAEEIDGQNKSLHREKIKLERAAHAESIRVERAAHAESICVDREQRAMKAAEAHRADRKRAKRELLTALLANGTGFAVAAVMGLLLTIVVLWGWQAEGLGVFSQAFAVHIAGTQLAVLGQQNTLVNTMAMAKGDEGAARRALADSVPIAVVGALVFAGLVYISASPIAVWLDSPKMEPALRYTAYSVALGSLVKLVMAVLTGGEKLVALAFMQGFRPTLILLAALALWYLQRPIEVIMLGIAIAEGVSLIVGSVLAFSVLSPSAQGELLPKLESSRGAALWFGLKSMPSGVLAELNTRVDILILGLFAADRIVGIYAFAAMLAEGFYLLAVVLRLVFSARLVRMLAEPDPAPLLSFFRLWRGRVYVGAIALFIISVPLYPVAVWVLQVDPVMREGWLVYGLLALGVVVASGYVPFSTLLMLSGRPGMHSLYFGGIILVNIVGNLILTPWLGMYGTAIATAIAYASGTVVIIYLAKRILGLRLA